MFPDEDREEEEDGPGEVLAVINTTPLVDVMLVLLIVFLVTVPVVLAEKAVALPAESAHPVQTQLQAARLSVDRDGRLFWGESPLSGEEELMARLKALAADQDAPPLKVLGDRDARFGAIGRVVELAREAGLARLDFVTEPAGE